MIYMREKRRWRTLWR